MRAVDLITKTQHKEQLSKDEIAFLISSNVSFTNGQVVSTYSIPNLFNFSSSTTNKHKRLSCKSLSSKCLKLKK